MKCSEEIWKVFIDGYYEVSSLGRIRSMDRTVSTKNGRVYKFKGKILKATKMANGYLGFAISISGKTRTIAIHRAVHISFSGEDKKDMDVNHIDGNSHNNRADNLEWMTRKENIIHSHRLGLALPISKRLQLKYQNKLTSLK